MRWTFLVLAGNGLASDPFSPPRLDWAIGTGGGVDGFEGAKGMDGLEYLRRRKDDDEDDEGDGLATENDRARLPGNAGGLGVVLDWSVRDDTGGESGSSSSVME